jgi:hypothetical protein
MSVGKFLTNKLVLVSLSLILRDGNLLERLERGFALRNIRIKIRYLRSDTRSTSELQGSRRARTRSLAEKVASPYTYLGLVRTPEPLISPT